MKSSNITKYDRIFKSNKIVLNFRYLDEIITDEEVLQKFYTDFRAITGGVQTQTAFTKEFFRKNEKYVNKESYVFYTLKTIKESYNREDSEDLRIMCEEALRDSKFISFDANNPREIKSGNEIKAMTAQDLIGIPPIARGKSEEKRRIEEMDKIIPLEGLFDINSVNEMDRCFGKKKSLNELIIRLCFLDALMEVTDISMKDKIRLLNDEKDGREKILDLAEEHREEITNKSLGTYFSKRIVENLRKYPEYFDIDAILLIAAFRANAYMESDKLDDKSTDAMCQLIKFYQKNIKSNYRTELEILVDNNGEVEPVTYSYKDLIHACERVVVADSVISKDGTIDYSQEVTGNKKALKYLSKEKEEELRSILTSDNVDIERLDDDLIRIMKFSIIEYRKIMEKQNMFHYFVSHKLLSDKELNSILLNMKVNNSDLATVIRQNLVDISKIKRYIHKNGVEDKSIYQALLESTEISIQEKFDYYINGKVDIDSINNMPEEEMKKIEKILSTQGLIELYKDETKQDEYMRYANIFRNMMLVQKTKKEKEEIGEQIIEQLELEFEEEDLVKLYQEHLITINTLISWGGDVLVADMMKKAMLKPVDVKEICANGNYDAIFEIMKDRAIPKQKKLTIFYTTFGDTDASDLTQEQKEYRELAKLECIKYMNFSDRNNNVSTGKKREKSKTTRGISETKKYNEYVSDPLGRWTLIELLDREYSYEILDQGMMIFKCPNIFENGAIFLEKMFKKEEVCYGRATKIIKMSIEEFDKIKKDLIIDGDIPVMSVNTHPEIKQENLESICHSASWGQKVADLCSYKTDSRRKKENIEAIDNTIESIKKSRTIIR